jgi:hypothetical protein
MIIEAQAVGPFFKNGFVVGCEDTHDAVLIDPGDEVASLLEAAERRRLAVRHILLTHAHVDHVTGVAAAKRALGVPVHLHHDDLFLYERAVETGRMFGLQVEPQPPIDEFYRAHGPARRGLWRAPRFDPERVARIRRRCDRSSRARARHDHWPGTSNQSVSGRLTLFIGTARCNRRWHR